MYCTTKGTEENSAMIHVRRQKQGLALIHMCTAQAGQKWLSLQLDTKKKSVTYKRKAIGLMASDSGWLLELKEGDNSKRGEMPKLTGQLLVTDFIIRQPKVLVFALERRTHLCFKNQCGPRRAVRCCLLILFDCSIVIILHAAPGRAQGHVKAG